MFFNIFIYIYGYFVYRICMYYVFLVSIYLLKESVGYTGKVEIFNQEKDVRLIHHAVTTKHIYSFYGHIFPHSPLRPRSIYFNTFISYFTLFLSKWNVVLAVLAFSMPFYLVLLLSFPRHVRFLLAMKSTFW